MYHNLEIMVTLKVYKNSIIISLKEFLYVFQWDSNKLELLKKIDISFYCKEENTEVNKKDKLLLTTKKNEVF